MTKENFTSIAIIVDESGSMDNVRKDTIGGINTFIETQKSVPGEAVYTFVKFAYETKFIHNFIDLKSVEPLKLEDYVPSGGTALLDAIGETIQYIGGKLSAMEESERPSKVIIAILTDGEENQSRSYNRERIKEMIEIQEKQYSWEFIFMAANQDAITAGSSIGIASASAMTYSSDSIGTVEAFSTLGKSLYRARSTGTRSLFTEEDRSEYLSKTKA